MKDATYPGDPIANLRIGKIIEVDGTHIIAELDPGINELSRVYAGEVYPIGQFGSIVKVHHGRRIIYGFVARLRMKSDFELERGAPVISPVDPNARIVEADLFGEAEWSSKDTTDWKLEFTRGVSNFPLPQQVLYLTPRTELAFIYGHASRTSVLLGEHVGAGGAPCFADLNEMLGKHTAVLGSTGSGKSGTVAAILHSIIGRGETLNYAKWHPQIVVLDPHNEYRVAFPSSRNLSTDDGSLVLPYWLFNLQETVALLIGKTEFVATSQVNILKAALLTAREEGAKAIGLTSDNITVDSPVPYSMVRVQALIEADRNTITAASKHESHNSILQKLALLIRDARMDFMMDEWAGKKDEIAEIMGQFMGDEKMISMVDLSGVPNEVAGLASAVIARLLFSFKVWQTDEERERTPVLLVCEEAHRYVPNRGEAQYEAAQEAIRRIAKEGRKYGLGLMLVSQRPSEIETTVLSQCNSWIVMRLTNDSDRESVKAMLPDSLGGLTKVLSGLRQREAVFVGQAATLPSRILIRKLAPDKLPRSRDIDFDTAWQAGSLASTEAEAVAKRWRTQTKAT